MSCLLRLSLFTLSLLSACTPPSTSYRLLSDEVIGRVKSPPYSRLQVKRAQESLRWRISHKLQGVKVESELKDFACLMVAQSLDSTTATGERASLEVPCVGQSNRTCLHACKRARLPREVSLPREYESIARRHDQLLWDDLQAIAAYQDQDTSAPEHYLKSCLTCEHSNRVKEMICERDLINLDLLSERALYSPIDNWLNQCSDLLNPKVQALIQFRDHSLKPPERIPYPNLIADLPASLQSQLSAHAALGEGMRLVDAPLDIPRIEALLESPDTSQIIAPEWAKVRDTLKRRVDVEMMPCLDQGFKSCLEPDRLHDTRRQARRYLSACRLCEYTTDVVSWLATLALDREPVWMSAQMDQGYAEPAQILLKRSAPAALIIREGERVTRLKLEPRLEHTDHKTRVEWMTSLSYHQARTPLATTLKLWRPRALWRGRSQTRASQLILSDARQAYAITPKDGITRWSRRFPFTTGGAVYPCEQLDAIPPGRLSELSDGGALCTRAESLVFWDHLGGDRVKVNCGDSCGPVVALASALDHSAGVKSAGVKSAGVKSAGVKSAGVKSAGVKSAGVKSAGVKSAGVKSAGVKSAGVKSAGVKSAEAIGGAETLVMVHVLNRTTRDHSRVENAVQLAYYDLTPPVELKSELESESRAELNSNARSGIKTPKARRAPVIREVNAPLLRPERWISVQDVSSLLAPDAPAALLTLSERRGQYALHLISAHTGRELWRANLKRERPLHAPSVKHVRLETPSDIKTDAQGVIGLLTERRLLLFELESGALIRSASVRNRARLNTKKRREALTYSTAWDHFEGQTFLAHPLNKTLYGARSNETLKPRLRLSKIALGARLTALDDQWVISSPRTGQVIGVTPDGGGVAWRWALKPFDTFSIGPHWSLIERAGELELNRVIPFGATPLYSHNTSHQIVTSEHEIDAHHLRSRCARGDRWACLTEGDALLGIDPRLSPSARVAPLMRWFEKRAHQGADDESTSDENISDESTSDESTSDESTSDESTSDESISERDQISKRSTHRRAQLSIALRSRLSLLWGAACQWGLGQACTRLGMLAELGLFSAMDPPEKSSSYFPRFEIARDYYRLGASLDDPLSSARIALLSEDGRGGPRDYESARRDHFNACEANIFDACARWARLNELGLGGPKRFTAALSAYHRACEAQVEWACERLENEAR